MSISNKINQIKIVDVYRMDKKNVVKGICFLLIAFSFIVVGILINWGYAIVGILFAIIGIITITQD
jgi:hypothetical protein